jgi:hypothetical protein
MYSPTNTIIAFILYWAVLVLSWTMKEKENELTFVLIVLYILLLVLHQSLNTFFTSFVIAVLFYMISYISVKHYKMWKHEYTSHTVPLWFPVAFAILSLVVIQVYEMKLF